MAKSILGHISGTRIFPNMQFVQAYRNYGNIKFHYRPNRGKIKELKKKTKLSYIYIQRTLGLPYFPHFRAKRCFQEIWLSYTTRHRSLTPCWVPEKTRESIRRKRPNRRTTDLIHMCYSSGHDPGSYRRISQLRGFAEDSKNKIQHNSD